MAVYIKVGGNQVLQILNSHAALNIHTGDFAAIKRVDKTRLNEKTAASVKV